MQLVITSEQRFVRTPDQNVYVSSVFNYEYWLRYLGVFSRVQIAARVKDAVSVPEGWQQVNGDDVSLLALPYFVGPRQYLQQRHKLLHTVHTLWNSKAAFVVTLPSSQIAQPFVERLNKLRQPYGVRIVGDPHDVFAPGVVKHPLRSFFRYWYTSQQQRICRQAAALSYYSASYLQQRYPPGKSSFVSNYSDVTLPDEAYVSQPRRYTRPKIDPTIVTVGSLEQMYKGVDVLLKAIRDCRTHGMRPQLIIVGDGLYRRHLERLAAELGLHEYVTFTGQLPSGKAVRDVLDNADLFVLASRTEGLPRAVVEAQARALPIVATTVGGIPELLTHEDMVPPNDAAALARKLEEVLGDAERMTAMCVRNLRVAREYHYDTLALRRRAFLQSVHDLTQEYLSAKS